MKKTQIPKILTKKCAIYIRLSFYVVSNQRFASGNDLWLRDMHYFVCQKRSSGRFNEGKIDCAQSLQGDHFRQQRANLVKWDFLSNLAPQTNTKTKTPITIYHG
ncbi:MAG: hypothetical protein K2H33_00505 [Muribaculaceae bacterium]|nr:hypothetical protein [Muribaculaceae bacterium]